MTSQKDIITINEREFILQALAEKKRNDGRNFFDFRHLRITFGQEPGQTEIQLGQTRIYAVVSCDIVEPFPDRPTEGFLTFNVEFSPMASPAFEVGRRSEYAVELSRVIERSLRNSRAIDTEALCIVAQQKVWSIKCDINVLDAGGNLMDAASIAVITALRHARKPDVTVIGETATVHPLYDREPVPLAIHHTPVSITFAFFQEGEFVIVDPNLKEELIMDGRMTITINEFGELCSVQKSGIPIEITTIFECSKIASIKASELTTIINKALEDSLKKPKQNPPPNRQLNPSQIDFVVDQQEIQTEEIDTDINKNDNKNNQNNNNLNNGVDVPKFLEKNKIPRKKKKKKKTAKA